MFSSLCLYPAWWHPMLRAVSSAHTLSCCPWHQCGVVRVQHRKGESALEKDLELGKLGEGFLQPSDA